MKILHALDPIISLVINIPNLFQFSLLLYALCNHDQFIKTDQTFVFNSDSENRFHTFLKGMIESKVYSDQENYLQKLFWHNI